MINEWHRWQNKFSGEMVIVKVFSCVTAQWDTVDHTTSCLAEWNLIWTAVVNSRVMVAESQTQS